MQPGVQKPPGCAFHSISFSFLSDKPGGKNCRRKHHYMQHRIRHSKIVSIGYLPILQQETAGQSHTRAHHRYQHHKPYACFSKKPPQHLPRYYRRNKYGIEIHRYNRQRPLPAQVIQWKSAAVDKHHKNENKCTHRTPVFLYSVFRLIRIPWPRFLRLQLLFSQSSCE